MVVDISNCPVCKYPIKYSNNQTTQPQCEKCRFPLKEYKAVLECLVLLSNLLSRERPGQSPTIEDIKSQIKKIIEWRVESSLIPEFKQFIQDIGLIVNTEINPHNISYLNDKRKEVKPAYEKLKEAINCYIQSNHSYQEERKSDYTETKNLPTKPEGESLALFKTQVQQEIQKQISPLQTQLQDIKNQIDTLQPQLQEVIKLLNLQNQANQAYSPSVASEAIQSEQHSPENTVANEYLEEIQNQSPEPTRQEYSNSSLDLPHIPWLKNYNQNPESCEKYQPLPLSITDESIHQCRLGVNQPIVLETKKKGNYWAFSLEDNVTTKRYLVPRANLKVNEYSLELIKFLFNFQQENILNYSKLKVIYPAVINQIEPDKWQLEAPGILLFEAN